MIIVWAIIFIAALIFALTVLFGAPYVPSLNTRLRLAFDDLYTVGESDVLVDIGSGDGRVLREVSRRGGRAIGYEINPLLVIVSRLLSLGDKRVRTRWGDYRMQQLPPDTTVVYIFGVSRNIEVIVGWVDEQARQAGKRVYVLSFGFESKNFPLLRRNDTHFLYQVGALQGVETSV